MSEQLSYLDRTRLKAESFVSDNTLRRRFDHGLPVRGATEARLALAAQKLGIKLPPPKETLKKTG